MPPLVASGYGLAMGDTPVFQGAFFLFLTNMLAIALTVAGMATWYGFGNLRTPRHLLWQTALAGVVLAVLAIPLVKTLNESVTRTLTVNQVEALLRKELDLEAGDLDKLSVRLPEGKPVQVSAVVFTRDYDKTAHDRLLPQLQAKLGQPVEFALDQVVLGDALLRAREAQSVIANPVGAALQPGLPLSDAQLLVRHLREVLPLPLVLSEVDATAKIAKLQIAPDFAVGLNTLRQMEARLQKRFPAWEITLIPPMRTLPEIRFMAGNASLVEDGRPALQTALWALKRWQVASVEVTGGASLQEDGRRSGSLAQQRAELIADQMRAAGLAAETAADYPTAAQKTLEKEFGVAAQRVVRIKPVMNGEAAENPAGMPSQNEAQRAL